MHSEEKEIPVKMSVVHILIILHTDLFSNRLVFDIRAKELRKHEAFVQTEQQPAGEFSEEQISALLEVILLIHDPINALQVHFK